MKYDQEVRFQQGSDTGEADSASIQPIGGSETYHATALNRQPSNLRARTEVLRKAVEDLNYFSDYDRAVALSSTGTFQVRHVTSGLYSVIATEDLWVHPVLSPGKTSGGRYRGARLFIGDVEGLGTLGVNDLAVVADSAHVGQRGYADGTDPGNGQTLSVGVNDVSVELVAEARSGGTGSVQITITGSPRRHIRIAWGTQSGGTTLAQLIAVVNADRTSQGATGAADYVFLSTTSPGTSTTIPTCSPAVLQGGYDAEGHLVTAAQLASFFGTVDNQLKDGEGLAIGFAGPVEEGAGSTGGRRQSLYDLPTDKVGGSSNNTTPAAGHNLFNTGREPERIAGALPIGKMINGVFVFVDGTTLIAPTATATNSRAIYLGESDASLARLGSTTPGSTGAANLGYATTTNWNADSGDSLSAANVQAALDEVQSDLAGTTGARRIGAETLAGSASVGNRAVTLSAGSVRQQLAVLANGSASSSSSGGVNTRVSEYGHRLHGKNPLEKVMSETGPEDLSGGGSSMIRTVLNGGTDATALTNAKEESSLMQLMPLVYPEELDEFATVIANPLIAAETIDRAGSANDQVRLSASKWADVSYNLSKLRSNVSDIAGSHPLRAIVKLTGLTGSTDVDGYYFISAFTSDQIALRRLDGTTPSFAGATLTSPTVSFYRPLIVGSAPDGTVIRNILPAGHTFLKQYGTGHIVRAYNTVTGDLAHEYSPTNARWQAGLTNERSTSNILVAGDKTLLSGVESNNPVDASASHHHGDKYTQTVANSANIINNRALNTVGTAGSPTVITDAYTPPTGHKLIGAHVLVTMTWKLSGAIASGADISNLMFIGTGLSNYIDASVYDKRPSVWGGGETFTRVFHGTIFYNASKQFSISFDDTSSAYSASLSNIRIDCVGRILGRT